MNRILLLKTFNARMKTILSSGAKIKLFIAKTKLNGPKKDLTKRSFSTQYSLEFNYTY